MHHLLYILNYFAELRASRHDDPLVPEWKATQLRAWAGFLVLLVGFGLSAAAANFLNTMDGNSILRPMSEQWRPTVAYLVIGGLGLVFLFAVYSGCSFVRFAKKHGIE